MKVRHDEDGAKFENGDACFGASFAPSASEIDIAKISIRGDYPENGWSYNEKAHEMTVITRGSGWLEVKGGERQKFTVGDVVYLPPMERFRWSGDFDMIVSCGPAFDASKYHTEDE